jgi:hypothetical protein
VLGSGNNMTYGYIGGMTTSGTSHSSPWMVFTPSGNVGIGTAAPTAKLSVAGNIYGKSISTPYSFEWSARSAVFPNGSQNQKLYINLGPIKYWGSLEVSIYDGWSHSRTTGKMTKLYDVGVNVGNPYPSQSRVLESFGHVATQWKLGEIEIGADNNVRIPIYHLVSQQNYITVHIKGHFAAMTLGAESGFVLTAPETSTHTLDLDHVSMALGSTQKIGIGTSNPTEKLDVVGNVRATQFIGDGSRLTGIVGGAGSALVVSANGNVGIGTTTPEEIFTIRKSAPATISPNYFVGLNLRNLSDGGNRILFGNSITTTLAAIDGTVTSSGAGTDDGVLTFSTSVNGLMTEKLRVSNVGNVGIGTANPVEKLDVVGSVRATQFIGDGSRLTGIIGGAGSALVVSANGNVGIGTTTPTTKLDVSGNVILRGSVNLKGFLDVGYDGDSLGKLSFHHSHLVPGNQYFTGFVYSNSSGQFNFETAPANNTTIMMGTNPNYDRLTFSGVSWNSTTSTKEYIPRMIIRGATGFVGIGTTTPTEKLHVVGNVKVDGVIRASDILVSTNVWADKVFDPGYKLMSLTDVANYIHENRHLPDVPSEAEVLEKGINVAKMQTIHMQKIEELTLYVIRLQEHIDQIQNELDELKSTRK